MCLFWQVAPRTNVYEGEKSTDISAQYVKQRLKHCVNSPLFFYRYENLCVFLYKGQKSVMGKRRKTFRQQSNVERKAMCRLCGKQERN